MTDHSYYMPHVVTSNELDKDIQAESDAIRYELDNGDDYDQMLVEGYQDIDPTMPVDMIIK